MLNKFILKCYESWIDKHVPIDEMLGECTMWARVMREAFPELIHVGGYTRVIPKEKSDDIEFFSLSFSAFNYNYHEYLITEDGDIVDPTKAQFDMVIGKDKWYYERFEEHLIN